MALTDRKISIVIISNLYPNCIETTKGIFIKQLVDSLKNQAEVTVVAPIPFNPMDYLIKNHVVPSSEIIDGVQVYHPRYVVIPKLLRSLTGYFFYLGIKKVIQNLLTEKKIDVISAHWVYPDGFGATLASKKFDLPIAVHALGCDINEYTKYRLRRKHIINTLRQSNINIVKSDALRNKIIELGIEARKTVVIHNGVDQTKFIPGNTTELRKQLKLSSDIKYVLFIGNFQIEKGLVYLIEAVKQCKRNNFQLLIIGSGPLESEIKALVSKLKMDDRINFLGRKDHQEIPDYLSAVDVLCLPSLREGCPNVVLESLSCGTPVVASNVGAVPEIITTKEYGEIVEPKNPASIAAGLSQVLDREEINFPKFQWYDWNENAQIIINHLNDISQK